MKINATRFHTRTAKIGRERTGLNGAIFVHVDFDQNMRITRVQISEKGKDDSMLDRILHAISDEITDLITKDLNEEMRA